MYYNYTRNKLMYMFNFMILWTILTVVLTSFGYIVWARTSPELDANFILKVQYLEKNIFSADVYSSFLVFLSIITTTLTGAFSFIGVWLLGIFSAYIIFIFKSLSNFANIREQFNESKLRIRYLNKKIDNEKEKKERQVNKIIDYSDDCYMRLSGELKILHVNTSAKMFLSKLASVSYFRNVFITELIPDLRTNSFEQVLKEVYRSQISKTAEIYLQKTRRWLLFRAFYEEGEIGVFFSDITNKKNSSIGIDSGVTLLEQLLDATVEPVTLIDLNWKYLMANDKWIRSFHLEDSKFEGVSMMNSIAMFQKEIAAYQKDLARGAGVKLPEFITTINNEKEWVRFEIKPYRNEDGKVAGFIVSAVFTTMARKRRKQVEKQRETERKLAYHDMLTGLPNRQLFHDRLNESLTNAYRNLKKTALLFIDLDGFKAVNDNLGHDIGDRLLQDVSIRLKNTVRGSDTVARLGGDEFTAILNNIDEEQDVVTIASKLIKVMAEPFDYGEGVVAKVTGSIGIAMYPKDGSNSVDLIRNADEGMYKAKNNGKNNYVFYEKQGFDIKQANIIEKDILESISNNEFVLHYQGHFDAEKKKVYGVEALLRWNHPQYGLLSASDFLPEFEQKNVMVDLGQFVLTKACQQLKDWENEGQTGLLLTVNMSSREFQEKSLINRISKIMKEYDIKPNSLGLEISENIIISNSGTIASIIKELKALGIVIIIEKLEKGNNSLDIIKDKHIDMLKINYAYLSQIGKDGDAEAAIKEFIKMARGMGMEPAADCVETPEQEAFLIANGCYKMQGYLYGRPSRPTKHFIVNKDEEKA
ncbi:MAG: EAL domain-containing protein [Proteobacteria bacterium]|nr:EAL domain-containing protein [Pseudomonadota bacterium]